VVMMAMMVIMGRHSLSRVLDISDRLVRAVR
jgi:hypothetical protein